MASKRRAVYRKWDIVLADLNPTRGAEMAKVRPCLIVSPSAMNKHLSTLIIAPFTSTRRGYPSRVATMHRGGAGEVCLDQLKTISSDRIIRREGALDAASRPTVNAVLQQMFSEP